jgi:hypothetical protein
MKGYGGSSGSRMFLAYCIERCESHLDASRYIRATQDSSWREKEPENITLRALLLDIIAAQERFLILDSKADRDILVNGAIENPRT